MNHCLGINSITCRTAIHRDDLNAAFELIYRRYLATGLTRPNQIGTRIAEYQLSSRCEIIVAKHAGRVIGTVSLIGASPDALPLESTFPTALYDMRQRGLKPLEIGCLAAEDDGPGVFSPTFAALTKAAIERARERGCERMVAAVHPRHGRFYQRNMGFEQLSEPVPYETVAGKLAVCVAGDPIDSAAYRSPWRKLFFGEQRPHSDSSLRVMSASDRHFFANLILVSESLPILRAA